MERNYELGIRPLIALERGCSGFDAIYRSILSVGGYIGLTDYLSTDINQSVTRKELPY